MGVGAAADEGLRRRPAVVLVAAGLVLLVLATFWPVLSAGFVHWDDHGYIVDNPRVNGGLGAEAFAWAFTTGHEANWHPLSWLSHMLDVSVHGLDPRGHHLTSVLIHAANAALLFLGLRGLTGATWRSAWAASLFAVHPLHVESVAWVSERKDVLASLFLLLAILAYLRHARAPAARRFAPVLVLFALGLMAKPMLVTLPFVLLLLDVWPLQRVRVAAGWSGLRRALVEKLPLLALSAASSAVTLVVQRDAMIGIETHPVGQRAANAVVSYARYLGRTVTSADLSNLELLPAQPWSGGQVAGAAALLCAISLGVSLRARQLPFLAVGWLWYLGMLVPVIGLVQVGRQALADRYTYLPLIGLFVAAAWGVGAAVARRRRLALAAAAAALLVVGALAGRARVQAAVWHDDFSLFGNAVRIDPDNWLMRNNLGLALVRAGRLDEALGHFRRAAATKPSFEEAWYNVGHTLELQGRYGEALPHLERAVALKPDYLAARAGLGAVLLELGRNREAAEHLAWAWYVSPDKAIVASNLGLAHRRLGDLAASERWYREALRLDPGNERALRALGRERGITSPR